MKDPMVNLLIFAGLVMLATLGFSRNGEAISPEEMLKNVHWLGKQASVKIQGGKKVIYIDPYQIAEKINDADIVLVTHSHKDHLSPVDIKKVAKGDTVFIAPQSCVSSIEAEFNTKVIVSQPGMSRRLGEIQIKAVPAYNVVKTKYHPKKNKWVGYILTIDGVKIYHAGDTERIPEMQQFTCDIVMLPLGQTYTMNSVEEAVEATLDVQAKIAIPIHYGMYEGTVEDAKKFQELLKNKVQVVIQTQQ
jgi:L-ascorbate metabolism protein UlaG (beta-lactamase superfamily)